MTRTGIIAGITPAEITENDKLIGAAGTRDGAIHTASWALARAIEGRVFTASVGSLTAPATFDVGFVVAEPSLVIDVPAAIAIIPLSIRIHFETVAGTLTQVGAISSDVNVGAGSSTPVTPVNNKSDGAASSCSLFSLYSSAGTSPATGTENEFWQSGTPWILATTEGNATQTYVWNYADGPIVVVGTGSLSVYANSIGTAPTGFMQVTYVEVPATRVS